jgi:hypothetical protein
MHSAAWLLEQEARALLTRLARVRPFALVESMVPAAAVSSEAQIAIEQYLADGRRELRTRVQHYVRWLRGPRGQAATPEEMQRRFTFLRLRFNVVLSQFDLFADVLTQRSEHGNGVWLAGLDVVADDALALRGTPFESPALVCYVDRGHGAAIRRARTRLPGGGENPVAVVRVPRERMVGSGIASSLVHEVGHQGAALLDLVNSLRAPLVAEQRRGGPEQAGWLMYERWISEIVADLWSVARVGVASTLGLMGVVSLPRAFVFRGGTDDPHPIPWIRVLLSCTMGSVLYPHPQWEKLAGVWEEFYPVNDELPERQRELLAVLRRTMPAFVRLLVSHRPPALRGASLAEAFCLPERQPARLAALWERAGGSFDRLRGGAPSLVMAVIGQARADGRLTPEAESRLLADLLTYWALRRTLDTSARAARMPRPALAS